MRSDKYVCKFCNYSRNVNVTKHGELYFYLCEECESMMCIECMYTSAKSGRDYCLYCKGNLQWEGKIL